MSQYNASGHKGYFTSTALGVGVAVKLTVVNGQTRVIPAAAATDKIIGVVATPCSANDTADVRLRSAQGTSKVKLGGTVAIGDFVTSDANGALITTTTAGNAIVGQAVEAGVSGDLIEVLNMTDRV